MGLPREYRRAASELIWQRRIERIRRTVTLRSGVALLDQDKVPAAIEILQRTVSTAPSFWRARIDLAQYGLLQGFLAARPDAGNLVKGGSDIRKLRWALSGRGKRGGVRVIYFWRVSESQILMLTMYAKN
jgi:hypothetical protein